VVLLLRTAPGSKYKAALATAYGAGLRVSEVVALKVGDIGSLKDGPVRQFQQRRADYSLDVRAARV